MWSGCGSGHGSCHCGHGPGGQRNEAHVNDINSNTVEESPLDNLDETVNP